MAQGQLVGVAFGPAGVCLGDARLEGGEDLPPALRPIGLGLQGHEGLLLLVGGRLQIEAVECGLREVKGGVVDVAAMPRQGPARGSKRGWQVAVDRPKPPRLLGLRLLRFACLGFRRRFLRHGRDCAG